MSHLSFTCHIKPGAAAERRRWATPAKELQYTDAHIRQTIASISHIPGWRVHMAEAMFSTPAHIYRITALKITDQHTRKQFIKHAKTLADAA